jgi:hypothetical protein
VTDFGCQTRNHHHRKYNNWAFAAEDVKFKCSQWELHSRLKLIFYPMHIYIYIYIYIYIEE